MVTGTRGDCLPSLPPIRRAWIDMYIRPYIHVHKCICIDAVQDI